MLAVGDAAFQNKCLEKMESVGESGKTVLFVSHNMPAVTRMCSRVLLLNKGQIIADGDAGEIVSQYLRRDGSASARDWTNRPEEAPRGDLASLKSITVVDANHQPKESFDIKEKIGVTIEYEVTEEGHGFLPMISLRDAYGVRICVSLENETEWLPKKRPCGIYKSTMWIPGNLLSEGMLYISVALRTTIPKHVVQFSERDVVVFNVVDNMEGGGARGDRVRDIPGVIRPKWQWNTDYLS